jgi:signal transduction histidine kinase/ligand-binding sensor domain-containing protein/DNA-binding response OmpR family regulator
MLNLKGKFVFILLFVGSVLGLGQQRAAFRYLSKIDGLSQSTVFAIAQDSTGFMWFGTRDGLNKYDGYEFKVFKQGEDSNGLVASDIRALYLDPLTKKMWIGTNAGLSVYDTNTDKFTSYRHHPDEKHSLSRNAIRTIYRDTKGRLWVATAAGLNLFNDQEKTFERFYFDSENGQDKIQTDVKAILQDKSGVLWFGTEKGLFQLQEEGTAFRFIRMDGKSSLQLGDIRVESLLEDAVGNFWIGTFGGGVFYWDRTNELTKEYKSDENDPFSLSHNNIRSMCQDKEGNIWIATFNGLNFLEAGSTKFQEMPTKSTTASGLSDKSIHSVFIDKRGSLWVGTYYGGVNHLDDQYSRFSNYQYSLLGNSISAKVVSSFAENEEGNIWIGTEGGGLNFWNRKKQQFKSYPYQNDQQQSISGSNIKTILPDNEKLWVGIFREGLNLFDPKTGQFTVFKHEPGEANSLSNNNVYSLLKQENRLWILTYGGGLNIFDLKTKEFKHYRNSSEATSLVSDLTRTILETKAGEIWIGTEQGLNKVELDDQLLPKRFLLYLPGEKIYAIQEDSQGFLWVGTFTHGLFRLNPQTNEQLHFTRADGLPGNTVFGIIEVSPTEFWLSTNNGLSKFNPQQTTFTNFDYSNGLENAEFNFNAYYRTRKGELLFGGINGFTIFDPTKIQPNDYIPPLAFTALYQNNKLVEPSDEESVLSKSINTTKRICFAYNEANFSLHFAALDFFSPENNRYAFKLEGIDRDWNYATGKTEATYTIQRDGEYVFRVKGANSDGVWNPEERQLLIEVLPPPWRTWWAYLLYLLIIGTIIYGLIRFVRLRHRLQLEQIAKQQQEELHEVKLRFFTNITHEFRTPLTLILGPLKELMRTENHPDKVKKQLSLIQKNAQRLLNLVNQVLTFRKLATDHEPMKITHGNIVEFLEEIFLPFQETAYRRHIRYQFKAESTEIKVWFDEDKLEKVFVNLLSNAFKFTADHGSIMMTVVVLDQRVVIKVEDDGEGIDPAYQDQIFKRFYEKSDAAHSNIKGTGIGLAISKQMVELHSGSIQVESAKGDGATFIVTLPLGNLHFEQSELVSTPEGAVYLPRKSTQFSKPTFINQNGSNLSEEDSVPPEDALKLLIVEDNPEVLQFIVSLFNKEYEVTTAINGKMGIDKAAKLQPDLIISDIMMPEMDGIEFCTLIKKDLQTSHIPVILLTANVAQEVKIGGLEIGADDYITKPFDAKELKLRVKNLAHARINLRNKFSRILNLSPTEITVTSADEEFLTNAMDIVEKHIENTDFGIEQFTHELAVSRPLLFTKLKAITNQTPNNFIKSIRLKRAAQLLKQRKINVSEVAYKVGFKDPRYFSKCFQKEFKQTPTQFMNQQ